MNRSHAKVSVLVLLQLLFYSLCSNGQGLLEGRVFDLDDGHALEGAAVYLPDLHRLNLSDATGHFRIPDLPKGHVLLQIVYTGYKTEVKRITLGDSSLILEIGLSQCVIEGPEVVVYGTTNSSLSETSKNIESITAEEMKQNGALSVSDGLSKLPGVSQLTTGPGISKPVIRGLYGNRIQTHVLGMRFDNQQWQDEHGLGLPDIGLDKVEVIKGPSALLYGSEAMGGVVNLVEEKPVAAGQIQGDISTRYFSNTGGISSDFGLRGASLKKWWRIRLGEDSHADYSDGNGTRILNSRFGSYHGKVGWGYSGKHWVSDNNYQFGLSNFGFLMEAGSPMALDGRWSRSTDLPHHTVLMHILSSQNTFYLERSTIKIDLGFHSNSRQEQEGGNRVSLNMLLNTYSTNVQWKKPFGNKGEVICGTQNQYQTNANYGSRTIVPDAHILEASVYSYLKRTFTIFTAEGGLRYDLRNLHTFETATLNSPGSDMLPFERLFKSLNGSAGISMVPSASLNIKFNLSSGYRSGNLAELSSNGLHEGTMRYEIGNPASKTEQNLCGELSTHYEGSLVSMQGAMYLNRFNNYIYLAPTGTQYYGLDIYRYQQKDAALKGGEASLVIHPEHLQMLRLEAGYSHVSGKSKEDDSNLPYIAANKINTSIKLIFHDGHKLSKTYLRGGFDYVFAQNKIAQFETSTPAYQLINASFGAVLLKKMDLGITCKNVLNTSYYDHLSRFKYFGIRDQGRNLIFNLSYHF